MCIHALPGSRGCPQPETETVTVCEPSGLDQVGKLLIKKDLLWQICRTDSKLRLAKRPGIRPDHMITSELREIAFGSYRLSFTTSL